MLDPSLIIMAPYTFPAAIHRSAERRIYSANLYPANSSPSSILDEVRPAPNPENVYKADQANKKAIYFQLKETLFENVAELVKEAEWAGDPVSQASLSDLRSFVEQISFFQSPSIYLLDNGNFRMIWKNSANEQAAIQFRGDDLAHCVFFLRHTTPRPFLSRETLVDTLPRARAKLVNLEHLLQYDLPA
jgi:hypothetical protein